MFEKRQNIFEKNYITSAFPLNMNLFMNKQNHCSFSIINKQINNTAFCLYLQGCHITHQNWCFGSPIPKSLNWSHGWHYASLSYNSSELVLCSTNTKELKLVTWLMLCESKLFIYIYTKLRLNRIWMKRDQIPSEDVCSFLG